MIYSELGEILRSALYAVFFGFFFSALSSFASIFCICALNLIRLPKELLGGTKDKTSLLKLYKTKPEIELFGGKCKQILSDLLTFVTFGFLFSLLSYISTDGVFRLYVFIISVCSTLLFSKAFAGFYKAFFLKLYLFIHFFLLAIFAAPVFLLRRLFALVFGQASRRVLAFCERNRKGVRGHKKNGAE